jgi:hypothetical protein
MHPDPVRSADDKYSWDGNGSKSAGLIHWIVDLVLVPRARWATFPSSPRQKKPWGLGELGVWPVSFDRSSQLVW